MNFLAPSFAQFAIKSTIKSQINTQHQVAQDDLRASGEGSRVQEGKDIVFDKVGPVNKPLILLPQPVLKRGERTPMPLT